MRWFNKEKLVQWGGRWPFNFRFSIYDGSTLSTTLKTGLLTTGLRLIIEIATLGCASLAMTERISIIEQGTPNYEVRNSAFFNPCF